MGQRMPCAWCVCVETNTHQMGGVRLAADCETVCGIIIRKKHASWPWLQQQPCILASLEHGDANDY